MTTDETLNLLSGDEANSKLKNHGIPLDHFDFKYISRCEDVKELEKIYRVLK
jgi:hypothetical protein